MLRLNALGVAVLLFLVSVRHGAGTGSVKAAADFQLKARMLALLYRVLLGESAMSNVLDWLARQCAKAAAASRRLLLCLFVSAPKALLLFVSDHGKAVASLVLVLFVGALLSKELIRPTIILRPIGLPKAATALGFSEDVAALRFRDGLSKIAGQANAFSRSDDGGQLRFMPLHHAFEIPGYKISYRTLVSIIRDLFNLQDVVVVGEFACIPTEQDWSCPSYKSLVLRLRIVRTADEAAIVEMEPPRHPDLDRYLLTAAEKVYEHIEPVTLMRYRYKTGDLDGADILAKRLSKPGSKHRSHGLEIQALIAWKKRGLIAQAERLFATSYEEASENERGYILNSWGVFARRSDHARLQEAIGKFRQALELTPDLKEAANNLGYALRMAGRYEEALSAYEKAIKLDDEYARAYYNRGHLHRRIGDLKRRAGDLEQAAVDYEQAAADYEQAIHIDPHYRKAWAALGFVNCKLQRYDEAAFAYGMADDGSSEISLVNWAKALIEAGDEKSARAKLKKALSLFPNYDRAHFYLGDLAERDGDLRSALEQYQLAAETAPLKNAQDWCRAKDTQARIARVARKLGRNEVADAAEQKARELEAHMNEDKAANE